MRVAADPTDYKRRVGRLGPLDDPTNGWVELWLPMLERLMWRSNKLLCTRVCDLESSSPNTVPPL